MQRTIRIQLDPSPVQAEALAETSRQFTAVFNAVCAFGWQQGKKTKKQRQAKRRMHSWPFASLKEKIAYKAEERGCTVAGVDPRHTSQTCSCCGHRARTNRRSQSVFKCQQCGYHLNADLNAARNIAAKYRAGGGISPAGGLRNQPIVSTTVQTQDSASVRS